MELVILTKNGIDATVDKKFKETFDAFIKDGWVQHYKEFEVAFARDSNGNILHVESIKPVESSKIESTVKTIEITEKSLTENEVKPVLKTRRIPKE